MRRKLKLELWFVFILCFCSNLIAQELVAEKGSFGVDVKNKIIVWHIPNLDTIKSINIKSIRFNHKFEIKESTFKNFSYQKKLSVTDGNTYTLFITKLPLIYLSLNTSKINSKDKIPGSFTYFNDKKYLKTAMGIRHRGNLSLSFDKKSFDLEFWEDNVNQQKKDVKFKELRSDDDWILDAMFNEPLRLRSLIAANLWTEIHTPYYLNKEPKAKSGFVVKYVEVFKNDQYYGIYQLSESVDRKQLKLKKNIKKTIYGELFKANSYQEGPSFKKSSETTNYLLTIWNGWKIKYPIIDQEVNWGNLEKFSDFVTNSSDSNFIKKLNSSHKCNFLIKQ